MRGAGPRVWRRSLAVAIARSGVPQGAGSRAASSDRRGGPAALPKRAACPLTQKYIELLTLLVRG